MEFCFLANEFYEKYKGCKEILVKQDRPYTVLIIETVNKKFAIPYYLTDVFPALINPCHLHRIYNRVPKKNLLIFSVVFLGCSLI